MRALARPSLRGRAGPCPVPQTMVCTMLRVRSRSSFSSFVRIILVRPELPEVINGIQFNDNEHEFILHLMIATL